MTWTGACSTSGGQRADGGKKDNKTRRCKARSKGKRRVPGLFKPNSAQYPVAVGLCRLLPKLRGVPFVTFLRIEARCRGLTRRPGR